MTDVPRQRLDVSGPVGGSVGITSGPTPSPGLSPSPTPPGGDGGSSPSPSPTPSPSPNPSPTPKPDWEVDPDLWVDPNWLRERAADCDEVADALARLIGPAQDAAKGLGWSAKGWSFSDSIDEMQGRWQDINQLIRDRLHHGADNFRTCADAYDDLETTNAAYFRG
ncbi:hypothetical protein [Streptomyces sp. NBC_01465]|uniref:hypothetical protein n=1 Tax=Streptomyces sp. NBC_01465 TaxID=2903878 RepID=UPI002E37668D|nr:hypothetical protein [Streptomyces sp. NBC_01465]